MSFLVQEDWEMTAGRHDTDNGAMNASDALPGTRRPTTRLKELRIHSIWEVCLESQIADESGGSDEGSASCDSSMPQNRVRYTGSFIFPHFQSKR